MVRAVVFDVGETLLDDSREWAAWADWIGVSRHTFSTVLGAVTGAGRDNAETFQYFRPGFNLAQERERREEAGRGECIEESDLYQDVRASLGALRAGGLGVGVAGRTSMSVAAPTDGCLAPPPARCRASCRNCRPCTRSSPPRFPEWLQRGTWPTNRPLPDRRGWRW
jgi:hypothetical protein